MIFRLLRRIVHRFYKERLHMTWQKGYDYGLDTGFNMGCEYMSKKLRRNVN